MTDNARRTTTASPMRTATISPSPLTRTTTSPHRERHRTTMNQNNWQWRSRTALYYGPHFVIGGGGAVTEGQAHTGTTDAADAAVQQQDVDVDFYAMLALHRHFLDSTAAGTGNDDVDTTADGSRVSVIGGWGAAIVAGVSATAADLLALAGVHGAMRQRQRGDDVGTATTFAMGDGTGGVASQSDYYGGSMVVPRVPDALAVDVLSVPVEVDVSSVRVVMADVDDGGSGRRASSARSSPLAVLSEQDVTEVSHSAAVHTARTLQLRCVVYANLPNDLSIVTATLAHCDALAMDASTKPGVRATAVMKDVDEDGMLELQPRSKKSAAHDSTASSSMTIRGPSKAQDQAHTIVLDLPAVQSDAQTVTLCLSVVSADKKCTLRSYLRVIMDKSHGGVPVSTVVERQVVELDGVAYTLHEIYGDVDDKQEDSIATAAASSKLAPTDSVIVDMDAKLPSAPSASSAPTTTTSTTTTSTTTTSDCVICLAEPRTTIALPCRHLCLCTECADILRHAPPVVTRAGANYNNNGGPRMTTGARCPICRQALHALLELHDALSIGTGEL